MLFVIRRIHRSRFFIFVVVILITSFSLYKFQNQEVSVQATSPDGRFTVRVTTSPSLPAYLGGGAKPINYYITDNRKGISRLFHSSLNLVDFEHWLIPGSIQWSPSSRYFIVLSEFDGHYSANMGAYALVPETITANYIDYEEWKKVIKQESLGKTMSKTTYHGH